MHAPSIDFLPSYQLDRINIELVEEMELLGLIFTSNLKFDKNTDHIVKKGFKRIWMLKRLKNLSSQEEQLIDVYIKQLCSVLELAVQCGTLVSP